MNVKIPRAAFNEAYLPFLDDEEHRYLVFYGGAGSGKSVFIVQRFLVKLMRSPMCNLLVVRAVGDTNRSSTCALFLQMIRKWGLSRLFAWSESNLVIRCANGNSVIFKGLDNSEKLKSITFPKGELTDVWIEEASEIEEQDFQQLDVRLRGQGAHKQMVLSFNPISVLHWLKRRFIDNAGPEAAVLKTTYRDNRFLDEPYKKMLESFKETDPYYYAVYCEGDWGVLGKTVFDAQKVARRLKEIQPPVRQGDFVFEVWYKPGNDTVLIRDKSIRFVDSSAGMIKVYKEPEEGVPYVIGADTAGEGSDYFVAQVLDNRTGEQVCTLRGHLDEDVFGDQLYCLGMYYNRALLAPEANFSTAPIKRLEHRHYTKMYVRQAEDDYTHKPRQSFGFRTTSITRPLIIAGLVEVVREHPEWINDHDTLDEMLTFVRNEKGRPEAEKGAHDDCVMALAIAYYCRDQQDTGVRTERTWTSSMLEDYENASPEEKSVMRRKWGTPRRPERVWE